MKEEDIHSYENPGAHLTEKETPEPEAEETKLFQSQRMESVGHLAAGIAHEINSPMQFIGDITNYLKEVFPDLLLSYKEIEEVIEHSTQLTTEQKDVLLKEIELVQAEANIPFLSTQILESMEEALACVDRVREIIKSMLRFADSGNGFVQFTNVPKVIEDIVCISRNDWKEAGEVIVEFEEEFPEIPVFKGEFNQAILNLINNAAQAILEFQSQLSVGEEKRQGQISIKGWIEKDAESRAIIEIQDNGIGIPQEIQAKIFDPYFTTRDVGSGTGLGLAIVHDIIEGKHKGSLTFKSKEGEGTVFRISLLTEKSQFPSGAIQNPFAES